MRSTLVVIAVVVALVLPMKVYAMTAEEGIRFLLREMNNPGIGNDVFGGPNEALELRLFAFGAAFGLKDESLIELRTELGKSEVYLIDTATKKLVKATGFERLQGGYTLKYQAHNYVFLCSLGMQHVTVVD